ncbi:MAG: lamin tail domain-containing protein, partial [Bacteroidales bacterium]|nr:lamin tail domain-containing protein [Bacteroidales bacterium]
TSEIFDDFEDGDLNGWGNTMDWNNSNIEAINGSLSLKHHLLGTVGSSYIFHDLAALSLDEKSVVWRFKLKNGDWDPTTQNRFWFYLLANENDLLSASVDGYAVGVQMAAAGSEDFLSLWKITDGTIEQLLIESEFDWGASNNLGIEVVRTTLGNWMLSYDENANFDNLKLVGSAVNTDYQFTDYCGLVFRFEGATFRAGELWLDDLSVSPDNISPAISSVITLNSNTLKIQFSEQLNQSIAETINNYVVNDFEQPSNVTLNTDQTSIELSFASEFITNQNYSITVSNIEDISGNIMPESTLEFVYIPFIVQQLFIPGKNELLLDFSHPLEQSSAENLNNYMVDNSIGRPFAAELINDTLVRLQFADFTANTNYSVNVSDIKDKVGILINGTDISFLYYPGNEFDVVTNELMVDISPAPNVLPSAKYIELFNRSATAIDLSGWWFQVGNNSPRSFDNYILNPKEYLILCPAGTITDFISFGDALGVLSESQLISSGTAISLINPEWKIIDYVNYSENWYADDSKKNGGWSLERIDNDNFCGETNNWKASVDFKGGTPGKINSVYTPNKDESLPALLDLQVASSNKLILSFSKNLTDSTALNTANYSLNNVTNIIDFIQFSDTSRKTVIIKFIDHFYDRQQQEMQIKNLNDFCGNVLKDTLSIFNYYLIYPKAAYAESSNYLRIIFSEEVDILSAQEPGNYVISEGIGSPAFAFKHTEKRNEVFLEFPAAFSNAQYYKIAIKNVKDLNGNIMNSTELDFSFFNPSFNDVVINELLFNPKSGGVDFVEIYNKSNWPVDLSKLTIARRNDEGNLESFKVLSESNLFIEPGHFMAISSDTAKTKSDYPAISYDTFIQIPVLPAYNDDEGTVLLLHNDSIIDEFSYNDKMHFALITDPEGISLERIDPLKPTNDPDNWHSAAESYGFATPANKNSQFMQLSEGIDGELTIEPETFSPNNDGFEDVVFIRYKFNEPGYLANVSIYDGKGLLIKRLATNELLATQGEFSWDGLYQNNTKARIGIYIIYFEVFNLQGVVKKTKKTCVLASRLN